MVSVMFRFFLHMYACIIIAQVSSAEILCPGLTVACPNENTCCPVSTGDFGCCPMPEATCCSDLTHCCPHGYECNTAKETCTLGTKVQGWLTKTPAKPVNDTKCKDNSDCPGGSSSDKLKIKPVQNRCQAKGSFACPGGSACCPDGTTCCETPTGGYGCCQYEDATCCAGSNHCCPKDYTCDLKDMTCVRGKEVLSVKEHLPSTPVNATITCDDGSECPDSSTCCSVGSNHWGCCPLKQAVCCADGVHCCPQSYQCHERTGTCNKGSDLLFWVDMKP